MSEYSDSSDPFRSPGHSSNSFNSYPNALTDSTSTTAASYLLPPCNNDIASTEHIHTLAYDLQKRNENLVTVNAQLYQRISAMQREWEELITRLRDTEQGFSMQRQAFDDYRTSVEARYAADLEAAHQSAQDFANARFLELREQDMLRLRVLALEAFNQIVKYIPDV